MSGYIKIFRSMTDWEWYGNTNTKIVFLHLLLVANWKDSRLEGRVIPRGTALVSIEGLAKELCLGTKQIRNALKNLEQTGEISKKRARRGTLITIEKYSLYQDVVENKGNERAEEGQTKGNERAEEGQHHKKNKNNKNRRREEVFESSSVADELTDDDMTALMGIVQGEDFLKLIDKLAEIPSEKVSDYRAYAMACAKGVSE